MVPFLNLKRKKSRLSGSEPRRSSMTRADAKSAAGRYYVTGKTEVVVITRTNAFERGVALLHLSLRKERNEWLVGGRLKEELQGVVIVVDPLQ